MNLAIFSYVKEIYRPAFTDLRICDQNMVYLFIRLRSKKTYIPRFPSTHSHTLDSGPM